MLATSTKILNTLLQDKADGNLALDALNKNEALFYDLIKPSLNNLVKQPKQETISKILAYSKSLH